MSKRKIVVVTGTRAEYGLLYWLMREIKEDPALDLKIIATGMHLSPEFGLTYRLIEKDGFNIDAKVEMLLSSDTAVGIGKSIGLGIMGFTEVFAQLAPDLIIVLGDRFESLAAASAALVQRIPLAHIHGGELSEGAIDDAIRHAITKMSHLHFVAAEAYRKRVIQLGESPDHVFNVGAAGLERIKRTTLLSREAWEKQTNFKLGKINFLVTYHPETLNVDETTKTLKALFSALDQFEDANIIFTKANADEAGRLINAQIDDYVARHPKRCAAFITLGDVAYLSALQFVDVAIGNSSSGLIEVPSFGIPTINIGKRQAKRLRAASVIDVGCEAEMIEAAITQALSPAFKQIAAKGCSAYTEDHTSKRITEIIKKADLKQLIIKQFYDVSMT